MDKPTLRLLSLGAGVQSTALALLSIEGKLPRIDGAIFADTGWEPASVYRHLDLLDAALSAAGIPLYRVSSGDIRADSLDPAHRYVSMPSYVQNPDGTDGMGRRQCTSEYKVKPITRKVRELLGAPGPKYRTVPRGRIAEQWIGFSTDEIGRVGGQKNKVAYVRHVYPLLDYGWSRSICENYLRRNGWTVAKSACIGCPYHGNAQWRDLRDNRPDEWQDAIAFDAAIRKGGARGEPLRGENFLHRSRVPLSIAPIDRRTRGEREPLDWDAFERGDPDGCSPYSCRSGEPV